MIKAIIFDMDGVLYNSIPMHLKLWKDIFNKRNIPFNLKIFEEYNGNCSKDIAKKLIKKFNLDQTPEEIFNEKLKKEISIRDKMVNLFPETIPLLKKLKEKNIKIGIATGALPHTIEYVKKRFNIDSYCDTFVQRDDVKKGKPEPDLFLLAAKNLKIVPDECAVVEDAPNGIVAANKANMTSIAITNTSPKESFKDADYIINNLQEIIKILQGEN